MAQLLGVISQRAGTAARIVSEEAFGIFGMFAELLFPQSKIEYDGLPSLDNMQQVVIDGEDYVQVKYAAATRKQIERQRHIRTLQFLHKKVLPQPVFSIAPSPEEIASIDPSQQTKTVFYRGTLVSHIRDLNNPAPCPTACHPRVQTEMKGRVVPGLKKYFKDILGRDSDVKTVGLGANENLWGYTFTEAEDGSYRMRVVRGNFKICDLSEPMTPVDQRGVLFPILN